MQDPRAHIWKHKKTATFTPDEKKALWEMYQNTYSSIGLMFEKWDQIEQWYACSYYCCYDANNNIIACMLYWPSDYGNKIGLVISSTPQIAKTVTIPKLKELLKTRGYYIELSDMLEFLVRRDLDGIENIKDPRLIKKLVNGITDNDIFTDNDPRCTEYPIIKSSSITSRDTTGKETTMMKPAVPSVSGSYLRKITGLKELHRKALYGMPCVSQPGDSCGRGCIEGK